MKIIDVKSVIYQLGSLNPKRFVYALVENGQWLLLDKDKVLNFIGGKNITNKKLQMLIGQLYEIFKKGDCTYHEY